MQFNLHGNLEGGIIEVSDLSEIQVFLVDNFPDSDTRQRNFQCFLQFLESLDNTKVSRIWLDGSFCSNKKNPNDIDCIVFIEPVENNMDYFNSIKNNHSQFKNEYLDVYVCWDKNYFKIYTEMWYEFDYQESYWMGKFGFDRNRNSKGIIEIKREVI